MQGNIAAITSFFNHAGFKGRLRNYKLFRSRLELPLITVEMSRTGCFELARGDADILVQVQGGASLWQKERLLNIALQHVPENIQYLVWLDSDVFFDDKAWFKKLPSALERTPIVQCFTELVDLPAGSTEAPFDQGPVSGFSIAHLALSGARHESDFVPTSTLGFRRSLYGLAWAARVELLRRHGFYDSMILGSGDHAMACAALGRLSDAVRAAKMNKSQAEHYLIWARPFCDEIRGQVGVLQGRLLHLWHGSISDRKYLERHALLATLDFDPSRDLKLSASGPWEWSAKASMELRNAVAEYFFSRYEDGHLADHLTKPTLA